jgi:hypothetical protein
LARSVREAVQNEPKPIISKVDDFAERLDAIAARQDQLILQLEKVSKEHSRGPSLFSFTSKRHWSLRVFEVVMFTLSSGLLVSEGTRLAGVILSFTTFWASLMLSDDLAQARRARVLGS